MKSPRASATPSPRHSWFHFSCLLPGLCPPLTPPPRAVPTPEPSASDSHAFCPVRRSSESRQQGQGSGGERPSASSPGTRGHNAATSQGSQRITYVSCGHHHAHLPPTRQKHLTRLPRAGTEPALLRWGEVSCRGLRKAAGMWELPPHHCPYSSMGLHRLVVPHQRAGVT